MELPGSAETHRLFDLSPALLCIAGMDGYFKLVNPAFETTLGHDRDEFLSKPFVEFVHPEDRVRTLLELDEVARGNPVAHF